MSQPTATVKALGLQIKGISIMNIEQIMALRATNPSVYTWSRLADIWNENTGECRTVSAMRNMGHRAMKRARKNGIKLPCLEQTKQQKRTETHDSNGTTQIECSVPSENLDRSPDGILKAIGYSPDEWKITKWTVSDWESPTKDGGKQDMVAIKATLAPAGPNDLTPEMYAKLASEAFRHVSMPIPRRKPPSPVTNQDWYMEIPPIELHLGKRAHTSDVPENYDAKIAAHVFSNIIDRIVFTQQRNRCGHAILGIGGDFFNAESNSSTTHGTPQENDGRYKKLFQLGVKIYTEAIEKLRTVFPVIEVVFCCGNHARAMEFFLYEALRAYYHLAEDIKFSDNTRDTKVVTFGKCAIFYNHGDVNYKRTVASIPAEFPEEWGAAKYRELHMGHLHKEFVADEETGLTVRRISAPCAIDAWHYTNRYIGSLHRHQVFIWDSNHGLCSVIYIPVED